MYKPLASLVFKTSDLALNSDNDVGSCDTFKTNLTWNNINLRTVLGDMYDKYDTFNLCLNSIAQGFANNTFGTDVGDRNVLININGLPFINSSYDTTTKRVTNTSILGTFLFVRNTVASFNYNNSNTITFGKNQEQVNFNIFYKKTPGSTGGSSNIATTTVFPEATFIFYIFGVDKEVDSKNGSRF